MSDRDEGVRKLAEEIRQVVEQDWTGHNEHDARLIADCINRFQSEREAVLQSQLARALGEGAGLLGAIASFGQRVMSEVQEGVYSCDLCSGAKDDHQHDCSAGRLLKALASSPLSERAGEVLKAVGRSMAALDAMVGGHEVTPAQAKERVAAEVALGRAWDALRAELGKGGEGG